MAAHSTNPTQFPRQTRRSAPQAKGPGERHPFRRTRHEGRIFLPGEPIRETGIYEVLHHNEHRPAHEAVMHAGDAFPLCDTCHGDVRFRLIRTAPYIFDDEDFEPEQ
jgi:hypothetical protein